MNVLLLASHAVAEYDDVRMFHDLGYGIFAPGGYERPSRSGEGIRPPLPQVPEIPELVKACETQRERFGDPGPYIDWAKARLHDAVIEWADVIIVHHFLDRWIPDQWDRIKRKRVIWRTCGQSNPDLERLMTRYVDEGLEVIRYSPAEERYFGEIGAFAGQDALIRFGKYPEDYGPWTGDNGVVGNITQHMAQRGDACGYSFWIEATRGVPAAPAGPGSEVLPGGLGELSYEAMFGYLSHLRAYLYTGTTPASYTLGLIEAMMAGVPIVSIGAKAWGDGWGGSHLFEAAVDATIADREAGMKVQSLVSEATTFDDPAEARKRLLYLLEYDDMAEVISRHTRARAEQLFGIANIGPQWRAFLEDGIRW